MRGIDLLQIITGKELELVVDCLAVLFFEFLGYVFDKRTPFGCGV
jgi:hypothetical protein